MESTDQRVQSSYDGTGPWVLITAGNARIFGLVYTLNLKSGAELTPENILAADVITLIPSYDFFAPLRPVPVAGPDGRPEMIAPGVPKVGMARDPIVTTRDFTLKPYPTHIKNGPGVIFDFYDQMDDSDQATYRSFLDNARAKAHAEIAARSGLVIPDNSLIKTLAQKPGHG